MRIQAIAVSGLFVVVVGTGLIIGMSDDPPSRPTSSGALDRPTTTSPSVTLTPSQAPVPPQTSVRPSQGHSGGATAYVHQDARPAVRATRDTTRASSTVTSSTRARDTSAPGGKVGSTLPPEITPDERPTVPVDIDPPETTTTAPTTTTTSDNPNPTGPASELPTTTNTTETGAAGEPNG